jgi:hypothetical protein
VNSALRASGLTTVVDAAWRAAAPVPGRYGRGGAPTRLPMMVPRAQPVDEAEHFHKCEACGGWFDMRDLAVLDHEEPLPHCSEDQEQ